ncbi:MAG: gamma carbonic anhydrase family protein [Actinomycetota bacterium]
MPEPLILPIAGHAPQLHEQSWAAPNCTLVGRIVLGEGASVWYGATLRAETENIEIGAGSNIQDGVTIHVDPGFPARIGTGVTVGHNAVLHGCDIGDDTLVGMGAVVLNGATVGAGCLIAAGAVVSQGAVIPPGHMVAGVPAKVRRELSEAEQDGIRTNALLYQELVELHRDTGNV